MADAPDRSTIAPVSTRELSPRTLARLLEPDWRFDAPVLGGRGALTDVYTVGGDRVVVELSVDDRPVCVSIRLAPSPQASASAGLAIEWARPAPSDAGDAAVRALGAILRRKIPDGASTRWSIPSDAALRRPHALEAELRAESASFEEDPDGRLLAIDSAHYACLFGTSTRALRVPGAPGISVHHPAPRRGTELSGDLYPVPERFHRRAFRRYFAALGCTYDEGIPRTVPTPSTFAAATARVLGAPAPWQPRLVRGTGHSISPRAWIRRVLREDVLPVSVAPRWAVQLHRVVRAVTRPARSTVDVGILVHDVSFHAIGLHAIDHGFWQALTRRARERLATGGRGRAISLAAFFEGSLTRAAWDVWKRVEAPADFREAFARRHAELEAELARA